MPYSGSDQVLVSLAPDELSLATQFEVGVELKFDWEHDAILSGERPLADVIDAANIDPSRIRSVHLPPGTTHRHGMAVTPENRGTIINFVHTQQIVVPEAYLTVHPPKRFDYREQFQLLGELPELVDRPLSVENLPVECQWHSIPSLAYYAYVSEASDRLEEFWLTIDSAHLPTEPKSLSSIPALNSGWETDLVDSLASQGLSLPEGFVTTCERKLQRRVERYVPDGLLDDDRPNRWAPFALVVFLTAERLKSVHLNDPTDDSVPDLSSHDSEPLLECVIDCVLDHSDYIVLEPPAEAAETVSEMIQSLVSGTHK